MAKVDWMLAAEGSLQAGKSHYWFAHPIPDGSVAVLAAIGKPEGTYGQNDRGFMIARQMYLTKADGSIELHFEVQAKTQQPTMQYRIYLALIGS